MCHRPRGLDTFGWPVICPMATGSRDAGHLRAAGTATVTVTAIGTGLSILIVTVVAIGIGAETGIAAEISNGAMTGGAAGIATGIAGKP